MFWFDELLDTWMGICRGSGVIIMENKEWICVEVIRDGEVLFIFSRNTNKMYPVEMKGCKQEWGDRVVMPGEETLDSSLDILLEKNKAERIKKIQDELFPNQSLQARNTNFSEHYLEYGSDLIPTLKKALNPLDLEFTVIQL